ncbi:MAG TPA: DUF192 domain-containing protein [Planctomycetota bacterium]|nr:DUF192 domain-containing protein [Planctomycetota bacterium]
MRHAALFLALTALGLTSCDGTRAEPSTSASPAGAHVSLGGKKIDVAVYLTEKDRRHVAAQLAPPAETQGYLLAWPRERFLKLEGERTRVSFDVAFLGKDGTIVEISPLVGTNEEGLQPKVPAAYALLLAPGLPAKLGIKAGDKADLSPEITSAKPEELPLLKIGGASAWVELALTEAERQHGLMFRPHLSADDGMLFAYPEEGNHSFWMMNTMIPLDIAFFTDDGTLLNVNETPMYPNPRNPGDHYATSNSRGPARYVLEMNLGWFRKKGLVDGSGHVAPGTKAEIPPWAVKGSVD